MFKNYFKLAVRNLVKRRGYTVLNIAGLVIGFTCCLLIFQYVSYEKSYDDFHEKANQVVRLRLDSYQQGKLSWQSATIYPAIGPTLKRDYPEIEDFCRLHDANLLLANDEKQVKFSEEKGYYADASFLRMFNIQMLSGNPATALDGPDKLLLSESTAKKYFGSEPAMGKRLVYRDPGYTRTFEVTGIFKDYPANSHLTINHIASYATLSAINRFFGDTSNATETSFGWYDFYTYLQLKKGTDYKQLEKKLPAFCDKYINSIEWAKTNNVKAELYLLPLTDIHLYSNYNQEAEVNGNGKAVGFMFMIGLLIIGIAWINYINLATARSVERAREVGMRKVMGAARRDLMSQFLLESLLLNLTAVALAAVATFMLASPFNVLMGRELATEFSMQTIYWFIFAAIFVFGTLLSGVYPAFILSGYQPVKVLKGVFKNTSGGLVLRKGLIIAQFAISVILIAGTIIVYQQVDYMRNQSLGVNIRQNLVLDGAASIGDSLYQNTFQPFKDEILKQPGVKSMSVSTSVMGREIYWTNGIRRIAPDNPGSVTLYHLGIDYDFIPQFEMKLLAGRNFSRDFATDNKAAILNEKAVSLLGFPNAEKAINQKILRGRSDTLTVVGVVQSSHHQGLQKPIDPQIILLRPNNRNAYSIKTETGNMQQTLAAVEKTWNKYFPNDPFKYFFLDDFFNQQYKADTRFGSVFGLFAFLAILIACFGLLGLSAYNILQRTKEIGIRKVLGASTKNVLFILSKDFLKLVLVAFVLAVPVAWWVMHNWLQDFAYRININWWVFGIAGILALLIALGTISLQALKAAVANPVGALRSE
ncbi:MAG: ABC transporter permease [Chitinophagaceae bacterium]|nr:ABC transporter permease [Chitinophagaceae bacterium]